MEGLYGYKTCNEASDLPPGFRFHPTDEELVTHYLCPKVLDCKFTSEAVGEIDFNKVEPWDLPWRAKLGEKEWYFYSLRDRKYPTGLRTNRATDAGYWKATGKDKEIFRQKILVGMKKTLVFYKGRAPKGEKTNWVMHEYRLQGKKNSNISPKEWVICRVFNKSSTGNKVHISGLVTRLDLPPLIDLSSDESSMLPSNACEGPHVTCFSNLNKYRSIDEYCSTSETNFLCPNSILSPGIGPCTATLHCRDSILKQEQTTNSQNIKDEVGLELHAHDQLFPNSFSEQMDLDYFWNY